MTSKKKTPPRSSRRSFGRLRQFRSGRWKASYTGPDGILYEHPETFALKLDAEAWLTDRRREIDRELWSPPATVEQKKSKGAAQVTLTDYAERWLANRMVKGRQIRPRTREHYQSLLDDHILPTFGKKEVRAITRESVDRWYSKLAPDAPTVRAHAYSLLSTIMESARKRDRLVDVNPCEVVGAGTAQRKSQTTPATVEELETITMAMPPRLQAMVLLASWCALRFGELVELRRKDVELTKTTAQDENGDEVVIWHGVVKVRRAAVRLDSGWGIGDPKSDAGIRRVAIPPHLAPVIEHHLSEHVGSEAEDMLFPASNGGHMQPSTLYRHFYRARAVANRTDLRFHDLRHSGAVLAARTGATLAELMARLGHSTVGAAMRYQHAAQGRDQQIAAALSALAEK